MAGHSKWANIAAKKGRMDARRGKIFSVLSKEITVAARLGGGDVEFNPRLRGAVDKAKFENMPADNIKRAIQKGTGEIPGVVYEEIMYEGYGVGGVGVIVECTTDNKNRSASDVRSTFAKHGGNMGGEGSVAYNFSKRGQIIIEKSAAQEESLMELVLEAGAEDMKVFDTYFEVLTAQHDYDTVADAIKKAEIPTVESHVAYIPSVSVPVDEETYASIEKLVEKMEDLDDVQYVWHNAE